MALRCHRRKWLGSHRKQPGYRVELHPASHYALHRWRVTRQDVLQGNQATFGSYSRARVLKWKSHVQTHQNGRWTSRQRMFCAYLGRQQSSVHGFTHLPTMDRWERLAFEDMPLLRPERSKRANTNLKHWDFIGWVGISNDHQIEIIRFDMTGVHCDCL